MNKRDFLKLGIPKGVPMKMVRKAVKQSLQSGMAEEELQEKLRDVCRDPESFVNDKFFKKLAKSLMEFSSSRGEFIPDLKIKYRQWGQDLDPKSIEQMNLACQLPISAYGALMPDAHVGYGLPIGGVLATLNAVIPYAVGVDIACRMKMTVLDLPPKLIDKQPDVLIQAINKETKFGVGATFKSKRQHPVMDEKWDISPVTRRFKDKAWTQLGTSGSGNHFVEFGVLEINDPSVGLEKGEYLALLSHSGSRGAGNHVATYYSKLAMGMHRELPKEYQHLAWLDLNSQEGEEYWQAMELMGKYAAANHSLIHMYIARHLGVDVLLDIENHHNFAWKEKHHGESVIVHRKGATPAHEGVLGIIPGTMADFAYVVRGKGHPESLMSASHGAGRVMSRKQAKKTYNWAMAKDKLQIRKVKVITAGVDEVPMVYINIEEVMEYQRDLVEILARFQPRIVKMAPAGERPED